MSISDIKLWLYRKWHQFKDKMRAKFGKPQPGFSGGMFRVKSHSHDSATRRSHEIHNMMVGRGKVHRSTRKIPTW